MRRNCCLSPFTGERLMQINGRVQPFLHRKPGHMESAKAIISPRAGLGPHPKLRLQAQVHEVMRFQQFSRRPESAGWNWLRPFCFLHHQRQPAPPRRRADRTGARLRRWLRRRGFLFRFHRLVISSAGMVSRPGWGPCVGHPLSMSSRFFRHALSDGLAGTKQRQRESASGCNRGSLPNWLLPPAWGSQSK